MNDAFLDQHQKAFTKLSQNLDAVLFGELLIDPDELGEVAVTEFLDNVVIFGTGENVMKSDNIITFHNLHDLDFVVERLPHILVVINYIPTDLLHSLGTIFTATGYSVNSQNPL